MSGRVAAAPAAHARHRAPPFSGGAGTATLSAVIFRQIPSANRTGNVPGRELRLVGLHDALRGRPPSWALTAVPG